MDEKKNFTPNAIEDDELNDVAGGGFYGGGIGDYLRKSGMFNSEPKPESHFCFCCCTELAKEDVYYLSHRAGRKHEVCKSCYDLYPQLQLPR